MSSPKTSICICTLDRPQELKRCIDSIEAQTVKDFELVICRDEGRLVELKERSWRDAKGEYILFLDDDVTLEKDYLKNLTSIFEAGRDVAAATGPTYVPPEHRKNRDVFREGPIKNFYSWLFLEGKEMLPGRITSCGANTLGANYDTDIILKWQYVDFLEPSAFAVRSWALNYVGGFDLGFEGVGEWCDVDLAYRIREKTGWKLLFHPGLQSWHFPVRGDKVYNKRLDTASRYRNYVRFANRHLKKTPKHYLYRAFLRAYYLWRGL